MSSPIMELQEKQIADVGAAFRFYLLREGLPWVGGACAALSIWVFMSVRQYSFSLVLALIFFACIVRLGIAYQRLDRIFMKQIAEKLGFSYEQNAPIETVSGGFFEQGHSRTLENVLSGNYHNLPVRIFNYHFVTGEGKNQQTHRYTVFEVTFEKTVPQIAVLSRDDYFASFASGLIFGGSNFHLEGGFDKYFSIRVENHKEIEALQLFTPDIMGDFIDRAQSLNFFFFKDKLYIFDTKAITNREKLLALDALAQFLLTKWLPRLQRL